MYRISTTNSSTIVFGRSNALAVARSLARRMGVQPLVVRLPVVRER